MKVDRWNDVQAAFTVFININKTPEYESIKPSAQKEKNYIESSTYGSYDRFIFNPVVKFEIR